MGWAYSTIPAELMTMSMEPRSAITFAVTSGIAFSSRTSTWWNWMGMPAVECSSAAAASPSFCFTSIRAMVFAPASARAFGTCYSLGPLAPLRLGVVWSEEIWGCKGLESNNVKLLRQRDLGVISSWFRLLFFFFW